MGSLGTLSSLAGLGEGVIRGYEIGKDIEDRKERRADRAWERERITRQDQRQAELDTLAKQDRVEEKARQKVADDRDTAKFDAWKQEQAQKTKEALFTWGKVQDAAKKQRTMEVLSGYMAGEPLPEAALKELAQKHDVNEVTAQRIFDERDPGNARIVLTGHKYDGIDKDGNPTDYRSVPLFNATMREIVTSMGGKVQEPKTPKLAAVSRGSDIVNMETGETVRRGQPEADGDPKAESSLAAAQRVLEKRTARLQAWLKQKGYDPANPKIKNSSDRRVYEDLQKDVRTAEDALAEMDGGGGSAEDGAALAVADLPESVRSKALPGVRLTIRGKEYEVAEDGVTLNEVSGEAE